MELNSFEVRSADSMLQQKKKVIEPLVKPVRLFLNSAIEKLLEEQELVVF